MTQKEQMVEDFKRRFQMINEYDAKNGLLKEFVVSDTSLVEDGEEDLNAAGADPMAGGAAGADPMAGGAAGADPMAGGAAGADPMAGGAAGADPNAAGGENAAPPQGLDPMAGGAAGADPNMGGAPMDPSMGGGDTMQPDDEVIDVSELTDEQEDIEKEISKLNSKYDKAFQAIGAIAQLGQDTKSAVEDLKAEIERRNPTQIEKLGMQSAVSYPFNVKPEDYWRDKQENSNYRTEDDNNGKEQGQYVITKDDVDGDTNWKGIMDSLDNKDSIIYNQSLRNLMGF